LKQYQIYKGTNYCHRNKTQNMTNEVISLRLVSLVAKLQTHGLYIPTNAEHDSRTCKMHFTFSYPNKSNKYKHKLMALEELQNTAFHTHLHHQSHFVLVALHVSPQRSCKCFLLQKVSFNSFQQVSLIFFCFNCYECWTSGSCT